MDKKDIILELEKKIHGKLHFDEPMSHHVSFRSGGKADILLVPRDLEDVLFTVRLTSRKNIPLYVIGNGTKLLVSDKGLRGVVIKIGRSFSRINVSGSLITAQAGTPLSALLKRSSKEGLAGLEFLAGIPGTIGGAITMNAGNSTQWIGNFVSYVKVVDSNGEMQVLENKDCGFSYRHSAFQNSDRIVVEAQFLLNKDEPLHIEARIRDNLIRRKGSIPTTYPNAGCIFKNPLGASAGELIDRAGLKGLKMNNAQVSIIHGNFVENTGNSTSENLRALITEVKKVIKQKYGVDLEFEIILMGF